MKHLFRFAAQYNPTTKSWRLFEDELHHIIKVLRLKSDEEIELCSGEGDVALAKITGVSKADISFDVLSQTKKTKNKQEVFLLMPILKLKPFEDILPSLVELGIDGLYLFPFEGKAKDLFSEKIEERLKKIIWTATKQAKRAFLPKVHFFENLKDYQKKMEDEHFPSRCFIFEKDGVSVKDISPRPETTKTILALGCEAGFKDEQVKTFKDLNFKALSLGEETLRSTTAQLAATFWAKHWL